MRSACLLTCILISLSPLRAQPAEPPMEALVLADGDSGSEWVSAEATMEPDAEHARDGRAMHFHIDVNHETGQPDYPIGWPRTYLRVPDRLKDWSGWDFIDFWLFADTSREKFPDTPLGAIIRCPDRNKVADHALAGQGRVGALPLRTVERARPTNCAAVRLFISGVELQSRRCARLLDRRPLAAALRRADHHRHAAAQSCALRRSVVASRELTGMDEGESAEVLARCVGGGSPSARPARLGPGVHTLPLEVGGALPTGDYEVQAQIVGGERM